MAHPAVRPDSVTAPGPASGEPRTRAVLATTAGAVALAVLAPVLAQRGYVLSYDMVFVPEPPLSARVLGADGSAPRAVPSDLLIVLLSRLAPADIVQKAVLVAILVLAAAGAGRAAVRVGGVGAGGAVVASLVYGWSPYLAERLVLGHWALLLGYAALPWAVAAAVDARSGPPGALAPVCAWTVLAALGGGNAVVLLAPVVLAVLTVPDRRSPSGAAPHRGVAPARPLVYLGFVLAVSLPWVLPALLRPGGLASDPRAVEAFAARADSPLGVLGSLVTLGGIWNGAVVPVERGALLPAVVALLAVVAAVAAGLPAVAGRRGGRGTCAGGLLALGLASAAAWGPGADAVRWLVVHVPGLGILRDGQKFLAGWVMLVALCCGVATERAAGAARRLGLAAFVTAAAAALPVLLLPGLVWGAGGRLQPVEYPPVWAQVRAALAADPTPGAMVVLPWGPYRRFGWNGDRVVLDPAQRISGRAVVQDDDLPLREGRIEGEDPRARHVSLLLAAPGPLAQALAAAGYRYALVHAGLPGGAEVLLRLAPAACVVCGDDLTLVRLPTADGPTVPAAPAGQPEPPTAPALALGYVLAGVMTLCAIWISLRQRRREHSSREKSSDELASAG